MSRAIPRVLQLLLLGACIALAAPARAQSSPKDVARARVDFQRALELEQAGSWADALALFRQVGDVKMTPFVRYHIATNEEKLGRLVAALGGYRLAAREAAEVDAKLKEELDRKLKDIEARIPKLVLKRGRGADAARVQVDGVEMGETSMEVPLPFDPGPHLVEARIAGKKRFSETVTLDEGETYTVEVALGTPSSRPKRAQPEPAAEAETGASRPAWPYVLGGVGLVSLAASGFFFVRQQQDQAELDDVCGPGRDRCPPASETTYDDAKRHSLLAWVTLGAGAAAVGGAVYFLTRDDPKKPQASVAWSAAVTPRAFTTGLSGRF